MKSIKQACVVGGILLLFSTFGLMADDRVSMQNAAPTEGSVMVASSHNPCNPCGMKANPCGMKANPCNPCAGAGVDPGSITRPAGVKPYSSSNSASLVRQGEKLWNDTSLSTNGLSCNSCHVNGASFNPTYKKPYPHRVAMVTNQAGINQPITAEQMIQFCMKVPMAAKPLAWDSRELSALRAYVEEESQPAYASAASANPCAMKSAGNPCAMKANPCNPCAMKSNPCNPCAMKANPCNPCAMKSNPCNPCATKSNPCGKRW